MAREQVNKALPTVHTHTHVNNTHIPRQTLKAMRSHRLYVLESMLRKDEALQPNC